MPLFGPCDSWKTWGDVSIAEAAQVGELMNVSEDAGRGADRGRAGQSTFVHTELQRKKQESHRSGARRSGRSEGTGEAAMEEALAEGMGMVEEATAEEAMAAAATEEEVGWVVAVTEVAVMEVVKAVAGWVVVPTASGLPRSRTELHCQRVRPLTQQWQARARSLGSCLCWASLHW